jgi:hypothetical protein
VRKWRLYSVFARTMPEVPTSALGMFYAASAAVSFVAHLALEDWVQPNGAEWLAMAALGCLPMGLAIYFWDHGLKRGDIQALGAFSYVEPFIGAVLVAVFTTADTYGFAFSAEADDSGDTFTTRGKPGSVIYGDLAGGVVFARVLGANSAGQSMLESGGSTNAAAISVFRETLPHLRTQPARRAKWHGTKISSIAALRLIFGGDVRIPGGESDNSEQSGLGVPPCFFLVQG